jgi:hypothetical protein
MKSAIKFITSVLKNWMSSRIRSLADGQVGGNNRLRDFADGIITLILVISYLMFFNQLLVIWYQWLIWALEPFKSLT